MKTNDAELLFAFHLKMLLTVKKIKRANETESKAVVT